MIATLAPAEVAVPASGLPLVIRNGTVIDGTGARPTAPRAQESIPQPVPGAGLCFTTYSQPRRIQAVAAWLAARWRTAASAKSTASLTTAGSTLSNVSVGRCRLGIWPRSPCADSVRLGMPAREPDAVKVARVPDAWLDRVEAGIAAGGL